MVKFFKWFINILYAVFTMGMIALLIWGANWAVNTGGKNEDVPNLIKNEADVPHTIYFSDIIGFESVSILNAHRSHEIFIDSARDGSEKFWFIPMAWANRSISWTKNIFVAVLSPSYEIEQMEKYRGAVMIYGEDNNPSGIDFDGDGTPDTTAINWINGGPVPNLSFRNELKKYEKYNLEDYDKYVKFLDNKPVVKWAFAEILIILALTFFVVYQNPIDFKRTEDGVTEINKSFLPRLPLPKRRVKKKKRNKKKERRDE